MSHCGFDLLFPKTNGEAYFHVLICHFFIKNFFFSYWLFISLLWRNFCSSALLILKMDFPLVVELWEFFIYSENQTHLIHTLQRFCRLSFHFLDIVL